MLYYAGSTRHGMKNFFKLPHFEDDNLNINARLIYFMSAGIVLASILFSIFASFAMPALLKRAFFLGTFIIPSCLLIMLLVGSMRVKAAGYLLLFITWLTVTVGTVTAGSVDA